MKILLVEDSQTLRRVLSGDLEAAGHEVLTACSGEEAIQRVEAQPVDLILMDVEMPGLDGFETTRLIREILGATWVPILFVTSKEDEADFARGIDAGGDDYLVKPVKRVILQAKIRAMARIVTIRNQLSQANQELRDLSERCSLTKLYNRRVFLERAQERWDSSLHSRNTLAVLLLDIDFFKAYNDCYGHAAGDDCIVQVAQAIASCLNPSTDLLARYGGEEFIILLQNTGEEGARFVAEAIRYAVAKLKVPHLMSQVAHHVTISIGGSVIHRTTATQLLEQIHSADKWLANAKHNGGNHCVIKLYNPRHSLLVLDKTGEISTAVDRALHAQFRVVAVNNSKDGLTSARELQPDVLIVDLDLPENQPLEFVQSLQNQSILAQIPILWVASQAADIVRLSENTLRIDSYVIKPVAPSQWAAKVEALLN